MDTRKIKAFLKVASHQNFSKAAEHLGVAQSVVSKQVQELENELGFALFERTSKKVTLTELGASLVKPFQDQIQYLESAILDAQLRHKGKTSQIRIGFLASACFHFLPRVIREFQEQHPQISLVLTEDNPSYLIKSLEEGSLDIAFSRPAPVPSHLVSTPLLTHKLVLASPKISNNKLTIRSIFALEMEEGPSSFLAALEQIKKEGINVDHIVGVKDYHAAIIMVEAGLGLAVMPDSVIPLYSNRVNFEAFKEPILIPLMMSYKRNSSQLRLFADLVKRTVQESKI